MTDRIKRKGATYRLALQIIALQLKDMGVELICPLCEKPISFEDLYTTKKTEREHMIALIFDGPDTPENQRIVHFKCAKKKTHGKRTKGALGGDISEGARSRRLRKKNSPDYVKPPSRLKSRGFQQHPDLVRGPDGKVKPRKQK